MRNNDVDPFLLEVLKNGLDTVADEMALILMKTAYSGIVRDSMDFSTAVCDAEGQTLAQGLTTAMHLGSFYDAMRCLITTQKGNIFPDDVFIFNDPYASAGQHLPDIYIIKPIYYEDRLVAWATTIAHHCDVGGIVPGSNALGATEIYQEGIRIPILKFMERGKPNDSVWKLIQLNVRLPDLLMGDLQAQMASCTACERNMTELFRRYGSATMTAYFGHLHGYAERLARAEIRDIPDGVYEFTDHIDGLGKKPVPIVIKVKVTIAGDSAIVDWTGSSAQVKGGINSPVPFTKACAYTALRSVMTADVPNCHGYTRAIKLVAPVGSIMNPTMPAPCGARGITGYRMIDCLFGALAKAVPERVTADNMGGSTLPTVGGWHEGKPFVFCETFLGTWGAAATHDGQEGVPHMGANQSNVPVEMIEAGYPLRVVQYGFVQDTGGPGTFRGGLSIVREFELLTDEAVLNVRSDKRKFLPHGLFGGKPGTPSLNYLTHDGKDTLLPALLMETEPMYRGDRFRAILAGGGGYGEPLERDPERVLNDVSEEKISIAYARKHYAVVINPGIQPSLDIAATRRLRARRQQRAPAKAAAE
ncbi:MAG: hydantoinase B/oxoprolinase family protein [Proteobacteria bacterium]|nr:hydantoinase B/oxoprolinase family protein [Pseudomonadota bacterium]